MRSAVYPFRGMLNGTTLFMGCIYGCMLTLRGVLAECFGAEGKPCVSGQGWWQNASTDIQHTHTHCLLGIAMLFKHYLNYIIVQ